MLKLAQFIHMGLATLLVVPAVTLQDAPAGDLRGALSETVRALESLADIDRRLKAGDASGVDLILQSSETPGLSAKDTDSLLFDLRNGVSQLQQELDEILASSAGPSPMDATAVGPILNGNTTPPNTRPGVPSNGDAHTGLNDAQRERIGDIRPPVPVHEPQAVARSTRKSFEPKGFSADPVLHGRAYYRAGRYAEGLSLLSTVPDDVKAIYWSGRCLEKLEREEDAIGMYRRVIDTPDAGYLADRARLDIDFLEWKLRFKNDGPGRATGGQR
jgi:hypothetical protein